MRSIRILIILLLFNLHSHAQNFELKLNGQSIGETKTIDSLNYTTKHTNLKSINIEIETTSQRLSKLGYIQNKATVPSKANDSTYDSSFTLGPRIKFIHINIGTNTTVSKLIATPALQDSIFLRYQEIEEFLSQNTAALEKKGYALAKLKLTNIQQKGNTLYAELLFVSEKKRQLNEIVIKYATNSRKNTFPKGHLAQINHKFKNKTFNQDIVDDINNDFDKFRFVNQIKYPEILFTKDSTKVYVYLEQRKSNTFDGFIGFNNNESKNLVFNGYLDLALENTIQVGEQFSLYWKSDGNNQKTFNTALELPYLLKSPIGIKGQLNIFKQDSTFQNTKTAVDVSYYINYNTRLYVGYQSTVSSDIQNSSGSLIDDYSNSFITAKLDYSKFDYSHPLFIKKSSILLKAGLGKRQTNNQLGISKDNQQLFIELEAMHTFYMDAKNSINIKSQNYFLQSSDYFTNELYRFGGLNSIRGFTENSLTANLITSILTEYRYVLSRNFYLHTILDYCSLQTPDAVNNLNKTQNLLGIGLGIGVQTANGILKISLANGGSKSQKTKLSNTIIHLNYNVKF